MKGRNIYCLIGLLTLLYGCVYDDMSDCEGGEEGLLVHFTYTNDKGEDEFTDRVDQVNLFIFDEGGFYLSEHSYNARKLSEFQGANDIALPPGTYHIIAWGNVYGNDILPSLTEEVMIHSARVSYNETASGGDELYYAPRRTTLSQTDLTLYEVTIPEREKTEVTIDFMTAYYTLNVYVKGLRDYIGSYNQNPSVEVTGLPGTYNFHLGLGEYNWKFNRITQSVTLQNQMYAHAAFDIRYIEETNPVQIHVVKSTTQEIAHTVNLQEILKEYNYVLRLGVYAEIDVYIEFLDDGSVDVSLTIKGWNNTGVKPGM